MASSITIDFLAVIALIVTVYLSKRNIVINKYKNRIYLIAASLTIILLVLEISTILMQNIANGEVAVLQRIADTLGFSLSPLVPFIFIFFYINKGEKQNFKKIFAIPLYINALLCLTSFKTGWIFYVNNQNVYNKGSFFLIPTIISMFYFVIVVILALKNKEDYEEEDKKVLALVFLTPVLATIIQIAYKEIILIWGSVAISMILYYIFLRELQFKYDVQTGIKNRSAFEKEIENFQQKENDLAIVVFDINNLKDYNDRYGHKVGDEMITKTAKVLKECFKNIGEAYRIGGDEFCVICKDISNEMLKEKLNKVEQLLLKLNQKGSVEVELAYGYSLYSRNKSKSVHSTFSRADRAMYDHKAKLKVEGK